MKEDKFDPPWFAALLLGWLLKDDWDTPLGDYEEYYNEIVASSGANRAKWWYRGQVLKLIPDRLYEKLYWGRAMIKNYLTIGFRNLKKNRLVSGINILGLTGAVGCTIAVYLFLNVVNGSDDFHENAASLYLVGHSIEQLEKEERWGTTPAPLGAALDAAFPQIERMTRVVHRAASVQGASSTFQEIISFAEPAFLDMFSFPLQEGSKAALRDPGAVILSADMAAKYFQDTDPLGARLEVVYDNGQAVSFTVAGIAAPFPGTPTLKFDFLVALEHAARAGAPALTDWGGFVDATVIQISTPENVALIAENLTQFVAQQNAANPSWQIQSFFLDNVANPGWKAWDITRRAMRAPDPWAVGVMGSIALMTLLVASFNYINISLGFADRRLKEIGVRKTAGAEKKQLVFQLLTENLILCLLALVLGVLFAWLVLIPLFNDLFVEKISLDFYQHVGFWLFLFGLLAFLGLVSGAYPAFYIASFEPIAILRGRQKTGNKRRLTQVLLTVQFTLSLITVSLCTVAFSMGDFFVNRPWGYDAEDTVVVPILNKEQFFKMRDESLQLASVLEVSGAGNHIGRGPGQRAEVLVDGEATRAFIYDVGAKYLATLGIEMSRGESFANLAPSADSRAVIVNRAFTEGRDWTDAIGKTIRLEDSVYQVVGMVENFLTSPLFGQDVPAVFRSVPPDAFGVVTARVRPGTAEQVIASLERTWVQDFPEVPFEAYPQIDVYEGFYASFRKVALNVGYLGGFALLVSCMGLFGMAAQKASMHLKEVGVRKVMGATPASVVMLVNQGFLVILLIASLIATPLCFVVLKMMLSFSPTEIPLSFWPFTVANMLLFAVAGLSLASQIRRLIRVNPAEILRHG